MREVLGYLNHRRLKVRVGYKQFSFKRMRHARTFVPTRLLLFLQTFNRLERLCFSARFNTDEKLLQAFGGLNDRFETSRLAALNLDGPRSS